MDPKSLHTLELPKILDRLAGYCAFSASAALARALTPTADASEARRRQQETTEARKLLAVKTDVTIGGARDVRTLAVDAARGAVLLPADLLDIKNTLVAGRTLRRTLLRLSDQPGRDAQARLASLAQGIVECPGLVTAIASTIDERGEVLDSASDRLAAIRHDLHVAHDRLLQKLQAILNNPKYAPMLQEGIITQRDGRYVIPLKADFRGKLRGIVHDQSASGATLFIEPLATHDLTNRWRELQLHEQAEIRRILADLSRQVGEQADAILSTVEALADLDLAFARAKYADALRASEPTLVEMQPAASSRHPGAVVRLYSARHPLLDPAGVVPIDVALDDQTYALVITGPNTGGKTVSLKTVGLLTLMAQCGLHIPAQSGSALSVFQGVYADIGDEQSIEQSLSTFSSHITNTIRILQQADARSLVILDELGAGTDPAEGSALARAILSYLLDLGATTFVATHYPELKTFAHSTPCVHNASVEFDLETLSPTYHLTVGLPGRSNAFAIAARLGLHPTIVEEARKMVATTDLQAEALLDEIHRQRDAAREERARAEAARAEAEDLEHRLAARLEAIDDERRELLEAARAQARTELEQVRAELDELRREMRRLRASPLRAALEEVEEKVEALAEAAAAPVIAPPSSVPAPGKRALRLGDRVWAPAIQAEGTVTALTTGEAEVQIGRLRLRAKLDEIVLRADEAPQPPEPAVPARPGPAASPGLELDLRGQTVEEALLALDRYLDAAYLAGLPWVRIIHGKGTGKLRQAVRETLGSHALVKNHEPGKEGEGGEGVTVAHVANSITSFSASTRPSTEDS